MRKISWIVAVIFMIFCISLGLVLPDFVFSKSLKKSMEKVECFSIDPVEIGSAYSILDAMKSCSASENFFDYQEDLANLSKSELIDICNSFLAKVYPEAYGMETISFNENNMKVDAHMSVVDANTKKRWNENIQMEYEYALGQNEKSSVNSESVEAYSPVLWTVSAEKDDRTIVLIVDDKNKKVIQMSTYYTSHDESVGTDAAVEVAEVKKGVFSKYMSEIFLPYIEEYYDVSYAIADMNVTDSVIFLTDKNGEMSMLYVYMDGNLLNISSIF